ncbi:MAG TPA: hypothetical protein HPP77_00740 [Candidatus Hydrogenedentes bacterium]|nr:hypothetical protein [Candidatus Hydrogenedentota bacterium]HIJ74725.1 hypothetical protein [Candidatus Hydrogenedentota bacterium]
MPYHGHVENGVIVLDDAQLLPEGTEVVVEPLESAAAAEGSTPFRGTTYRFDAPFAPAVPPEDWDACR